MAISRSRKSFNTILALLVVLSISLSSDAQFEDYCVADEQATEVVLGYAMKWACSNGADCTAIQPDGTCFFPNTTKDHASYAFNSYFQNMKHNGGSCYFTANAVLTGVNPNQEDLWQWRFAKNGIYSTREAYQKMNLNTPMA